MGHTIKFAQPGYTPSKRHQQAARVLDAPEPGFFKIKLGGQIVPARIVHEPARDPETGEPLDRSYYWRADIGWQPGVPSVTPSESVLWIWTHADVISPAEYRALRAATRGPIPPGDLA